MVFRPEQIAVKNQEADVEMLMKSYRHGYEEAKQRQKEIESFLKDD